MFFVTQSFVTSKHTKQGHTVRIHGVLSHISRQDNPLLPRTDLRSHARTRASREQQLSAFRKNKRFFGNLHVMAAQLLPAQLLELQRRPQAARRLGLTQAAPEGSIVVPKGELNPRARVIPHLSARQPTQHEILRGRQFFPAASAGARCSRGASLHSRRNLVSDAEITLHIAVKESELLVHQIERERRHAAALRLGLVTRNVEHHGE